MNYWPEALMVISLATRLCAQAPEHTPCCEMKAALTPKSVAELTVTIKDVNAPVVRIVLTFPENDYKVRTVSEAGQPVKRTAFGNRLLVQPAESRRTHTELAPGQTFEEQLDLSRIFELSAGTYDVWLSRDVFVNSKRITLTAKTRVFIGRTDVR